MHAPWPVIDPPGVHFADEEDDVLLDDAETADDDEEACCEWLRQRLQPPLVGMAGKLVTGAGQR